MKVIFFSGAGISAPSGISTFRDENGLWENEKIDQICNIRTWRKNYDKVHKFYNNLRTSIADKVPNKAHLMIAKLQEKYGKDKIINITQNIDDLFEKAGCKETIHLHGFLRNIICQNEDCKRKIDIGYKEFNNEKCSCGKNKFKPDVVFFEEEAPEYYFAKKNLNSIESDDILVVIGTLGNVFDIMRYIKFIKYSNRQKPTLILNNLEESKYIQAHEFNHVFYDSCINVTEQIEEIIEKKLNC